MVIYKAGKVLLLTVFFLFAQHHCIAYFPKSINIELTFNDSLTTRLLHPPYISGTIGDVTDPAATLGFFINVKENKQSLPAADFEVKADLKESLLQQNEVQLEKKDGLVWVRIAALKPGENTFNIVVTYKGYTEPIEVNYAASLSSKQGGCWHTGISDASAAISVGGGYMLVADDELNVLNLYDYKKSGLPVRSFAYADHLNLQDKKDGEFREIDCEAVAVSPLHDGTAYWFGSMSNGGKDFEERMNRSALFSTSISGSGTGTAVSYSANYPDLRKEILKWGNDHGYKLSAAAKNGRTPKAKDGFNAEGACFAPDNSTLYIAFRAPLVPVTERAKAMIAPVTNFEQWFNGGRPAAPPVIGEPIELNLGGRGIRDIFKLPGKNYIIIAGGCDSSQVTALYLWGGHSSDVPEEIKTIQIADVPAEGGFALVENGIFSNKIVLITDSGNKDYYNSGNAGKNLDPGFRKFNTIVVQLPQ